MSRIPDVKMWRVAFYDGNHMLALARVRTINKRFARWLANERCGYPALRSTRVTVSLVNATQYPHSCEYAAKMGPNGDLIAVYPKSE